MRPLLPSEGWKEAQANDAVTGTRLPTIILLTAG
jgi:hypothetical protein